MKRTTAVGVVLAAFLSACGGSDQQQQSSNPPGRSSERPSEGFQEKRSTKGFRSPGAPAQPESYKQARAKVAREAKAGDTYVHAHLDMSSDQCSTGDQAVDWASNTEGSCYGIFKDGSEPFTRGRRGLSSWGKTSSPSRIRISMISLRNSKDPSLNVGCYISDRSSGDCYTDKGSRLQLNVASGDYILLRGMCREGDRVCTPSRSPTP